MADLLVQVSRVVTDYWGNDFEAMRLTVRGRRGRRRCVRKCPAMRIALRHALLREPAGGAEADDAGIAAEEDRGRRSVSGNCLLGELQEVFVVVVDVDLCCRLLRAVCCIMCIMSCIVFAY